MNNKRVFIVSGLVVAIVLAFSLLTSYAFWRVQKVQSGSNIVIGACLNIVLEETKDDNDEFIGGFSLDNAWPMTDEEGAAEEGYTFKIENTCSEPVNYQIVMESLKVEGKTSDDYLPDEYVKVQLDYGITRRYSELSVVENDQSALYADQIRETRLLYSGTIKGKSTEVIQNINTHNIKMWIADDADNSQSRKVFNSKIKIYAGQGIKLPDYPTTPEMCFDFDQETATITGYHEDECTTDYLVVPAAINRVIVKKIDFYNDDNEPMYCDDCSIHWNYVDLTQATGLESIIDFAFYGYVGQSQELKISNSVKYIGEGAFYNYNGSNLILGNNLEEIRREAFMNYVGENRELIIPNMVIDIYSDAFESYNGPKLVLGNKLKDIGTGAFKSYVGEDQELIIPDSVEDISSRAFESYNGPKLSLGNSLHSIIDKAFYSYEGTNQVLNIPDSVYTIKNEAFYNFNGSELNIGSGIGLGIGRIDSRVFYNHTGTINIKLSESEFNSRNISNEWKNPNVTPNFLQ